MTKRRFFIPMAAAFIIFAGGSLALTLEIRRGDREARFDSTRKSYALAAEMTAEGVSLGYFHRSDFRAAVLAGNEAWLETRLREIPQRFHHLRSAHLETLPPPEGDFEIGAMNGDLVAFFPLADSDGRHPLQNWRGVLVFDTGALLAATQTGQSPRVVLGGSRDFVFGLQAGFSSLAPTSADYLVSLLFGLVAAGAVGAMSRRHASLFYEAKGLEAIIYLFEQNEHYSANHSRNVASLALFLGSKLGLRGKRLRDLYTAALLHDIGKITVPMEILVKPGRLEPQERARVREHPAASARILASFPELAHLADFVAKHHERSDGQGYPGHIKGPIPLESRLIAVADVFEALTGERPYRWRLPIDEAIATMRGEALDPELVDLLDRTLADYPSFSLPKWAHSCRHPGNVIDTWEFAAALRPIALECGAKGM